MWCPYLPEVPGEAEGDGLPGESDVEEPHLQQPGDLGGVVGRGDGQRQGQTLLVAALDSNKHLLQVGLQFLLGNSALH